MNRIDIELDMALLKIMHTSTNFGPLLEEPSDRQEERARLTNEQEILLKAHGILSQFSWR